MKSPAHALALWLESKGVGTFGADTGWCISAAAEPVAPDTTVTLYDTPGREPLLYGKGDGKRYNQPAIQVRVRGADYPAAYSKAQQVRDLLNTIMNETIDGQLFVGAWLNSDIMSLGRDDNNRHRLTANYQLTREV